MKKNFKNYWPLVIKKRSKMNLLLFDKIILKD